MPKFKSSFLFVFISLLLFTSAILKTLALIEDRSLDWITSINAFTLIGFELFLAIWLASGLYSSFSRLVALGTFLVFFNYSLFQALTNQPSCGCFGKIEVKPWITVGLDTLLFLGLLFLGPPPEPNDEFISRRNRWISSLSCLCLFSILGLSIFLFKSSFFNLTHPNLKELNDPVTVNKNDLEKVIEGIESNYKDLVRFKYTTETTQTIHSTMKYLVNPTMKNLPKEELDNHIPPPVETIRRFTTTTLFDVNKIRSEKIYEDMKKNYLLYEDNARIQYDPEMKTAWYSETNTIDLGTSESEDIRLIGFVCPISSISNYIKNLEISAAGEFIEENNQKLFRIKGIAKTGNNIPLLVIADFFKDTNYLPAQIVYKFYPDGSIFCITNIQYQKLNNKIYFPKLITQKSFMKGATLDSKAKTGQAISNTTEVMAIDLNPSVENCEFDFTLEPNTILLGNIRKQPNSGDEPVLATKLIKKEGNQKESISQISKEIHSPQSFKWVVITIVNCILFVLITKNLKLAARRT